jgi:hypothetical protein
LAIREVNQKLLDYHKCEYLMYYHLYTRKITVHLDYHMM